MGLRRSPARRSSFAVGHRGMPHDAGELRAEVERAEPMPVPRHEPHVAAADDRERVEAVELQLVNPRGVVEWVVTAKERGGGDGRECHWPYGYPRGVAACSRDGEEPGLSEARTPPRHV